MLETKAAAPEQAKINARTAALSEEIDAIHSANMVHWKQKDGVNKAAKAQYQWRQDRLEEIRKELAQLPGEPPSAWRSQ